MIEDDVALLKSGGRIAMNEYLLIIADLTERAATKINRRVYLKKRWMTISALFLATSILITYSLHAYA